MPAPYVAALLICLSSIGIMDLPAFVQARMHQHHRIHGRKVAIRTTGQQPSPFQGPASNNVFNSTNAQREIKNVKVKYEKAESIMKDIDIGGKLKNMSLVNDFPAFDDPTTVFAFPNRSSGGHSIPPFISPATLPLATLPLTDFISGSLDILYTGPLDFGTPPQTLDMDIDTGSADLWVASECASCTTAQFDPKQSQTLERQNEDFSIAYGSGEVFGSLAVDVVKVAGLTSEKQAFGLVNMESPDFNGYPQSGILGLAFGTLSTSGNPSMFENLMDNGQVLAPFFAVHLARRSKTGSEVCFGCFDVTKTKGMVSWVPVVSKAYWTVAMSAIKSSGTAIETKLLAAIDTGTTLIYVPERVAEAFYKTIPGAKAIDSFGPGFFSFPCSASPQITFRFGDKEFALKAQDFNVGHLAAGSSDCVGGIVSLGSEFGDDIAIIGDEFLKSWYTVYDYSNGARVGFAPSINNA